MVERAVGKGVVLAEMMHMALDGSNRTKDGVTGKAMAEGFPLSRVLLISVGKGDKQGYAG